VRLSDSVLDLDGDALDGEFTNPWSLAESSGYASTFPSGDGKPGGEFRFRFTNLSADFNHDNIVDDSDGDVWDAHYPTSMGAAQTDGDSDGDGDVDLTDFDQWSNVQWGLAYSQWPSIEPGMILVSNATDESDANYSYGDLSLREALAVAATNSGADTIVFDPSISEIDLALGHLTIDSDVTIAGPGADLLSIDGQNSNRIFNVDAGVSDATIRGLTVTGGFADYGGGIYNLGALTVDECQIDNNVATIYGGGIYTGTGNSSSGLSMIGSTVSNNWAVYNGGGIYIASFGSSLATIANSAISGNQAEYGGNGGGIYDASSGAYIINSTLSLNAATLGSGGGIYGSAGTTLLNSIVADNSAYAASTNDLSGSFDSASDYNLIGYDPNQLFPTGSHNIIGVSSGIDARLAPLDYYGGHTKTHALYYDSPAIDAGDDATAVAFDLYGDQRANDRIDDGDGDTVAHVDIGAFELASDEYFSDV
jgi:hypothetical protein